MVRSKTRGFLRFSTSESRQSRETAAGMWITRVPPDPPSRGARGEERQDAEPRSATADRAVRRQRSSARTCFSAHRLLPDEPALPRSRRRDARMAAHKRSAPGRAGFRPEGGAAPFASLTPGAFEERPFCSIWSAVERSGNTGGTPLPKTSFPALRPHYSRRMAPSEARTFPLRALRVSESGREDRERPFRLRTKTCWANCPQDASTGARTSPTFRYASPCRTA